MASQRIRAFIAIELPAVAREALGQVVHHLQQRGVGGVRWVRPEGIHLTLKFLGSIMPDTVEPLSQALARAAEGVPPFSLELAELGAFPSVQRPRVLWVALRGGLEHLTGLQQRVEQALTALGFPQEERPFSPHVTLGRVRETASGLREALEEVPPPSTLPWQVEGLNLMQSTLAPSGAVYRRLRHIPLG